MYFAPWYKKGGDFMLKSYTDADWDGTIDDQKSTSGSAFFLGDRLVSLFNKKHDSVSLSTAKA